MDVLKHTMMYLKDDLKGEVIKGIGLASKLGFPTINITNDLNIEPNVYFIVHKHHGLGSAIVMKDYCEVHFMDEPQNKEEYLECKILKGIFTEGKEPNEGTVARLLYDGVLNERTRL